MQKWVESARATLVQVAIRALRLHVVHNRSGLPPFRLPQIAEQIVAGLVGFACGGDGEDVRALGGRLAEQGLGLRSLLAVIRGIVREGPPSAQGLQLEDFTDLLVEGLASREVADVVRQRDEMQAAAERAARKRESELRQVIEEMSTPIMPIHDRILVLPLVGGIDGDRAGRITENLLNEVTLRKARIIIIDITGVLTVDAEIAGAIVRTARAVQLLGARAVIVGVRAELARTIVDAAIDLAGLPTLANLQTGIAWALGQQGLAIQPRASVGRESTRSGQ